MEERWLRRVQRAQHTLCITNTHIHNQVNLHSDASHCSQRMSPFAQSPTALISCPPAIQSIHRMVWRGHWEVRDCIGGGKISLIPPKDLPNISATLVTTLLPPPTSCLCLSSPSFTTWINNEAPAARKSKMPENCRVYSAKQMASSKPFYLLRPEPKFLVADEVSNL